MKKTLINFSTFVIFIFVTSICFAAGIYNELPNLELTPGVAVEGMTVDKLCSTQWGKDKRMVTDGMKQSVIEAYQFDVNECPLTEYKGQQVHRLEIDHLKSRELGGADDIKNLWPQCYEPTADDKSWQLNGAHKKDELENRLHKEICAGNMTIEEAQTCIATDWVACYERVFK